MKTADYLNVLDAWRRGEVVEINSTSSKHTWYTLQAFNGEMDLPYALKFPNDYLFRIKPPEPLVVYLFDKNEANKGPGRPGNITLYRLGASYEGGTDEKDVKAYIDDAYENPNAKVRKFIEVIE